MKFIDYIFLALLATPMLLVIAASYFLNSERDEDWQKPADEDDNHET